MKPASVAELGAQVAGQAVDDAGVDRPGCPGPGAGDLVFDRFEQRAVAGDIDLAGLPAHAGPPWLRVLALVWRWRAGAPVEVVVAAGTCRRTVGRAAFGPGV